MEHYYVISGSEFGAYLDSKQNFRIEQLDLAKFAFESLKHQYEFICLMYVNENGEEIRVSLYSTEDEFEDDSVEHDLNSDIDKFLNTIKPNSTSTKQDKRSDNPDDLINFLNN